MDAPQQPRYYVVFAETAFNSWDEVMQNAAEDVAQHIARSKQLHEQGVLLMSGAFLDPPPGEPVTTMGVLVSRDAAEAYITGDPFVLKGQVKRWYIREWANMFYTPPDRPTA